jgi:hypothetical protein
MKNTKPQTHRIRYIGSKGRVRNDILIQDISREAAEQEFRKEFKLEVIPS